MQTEQRTTHVSHTHKHFHFNRRILCRTLHVVGLIAFFVLFRTALRLYCIFLTGIPFAIRNKAFRLAEQSPITGLKSLCRRTSRAQPLGMGMDRRMCHVVRQHVPRVGGSSFQGHRAPTWCEQNTFARHIFSCFVRMFNVVPMGFFVISAKGLPVLVFVFTFECNTGALDVVLEKLHSNVRKIFVAMVWGMFVISCESFVASWTKLLRYV